MTAKLLAPLSAVLVIAAPAAAASRAPKPASGPDVAYNILFLKEGKVLAARTVVGPFGHDIRVELPELMRVVVSARAPSIGDSSFTTAKMAVYAQGAWQPAKEMSMKADLSATPSFEYSVDGTPYRFVVMPRMIVRAVSQ